MKLKKLQPGDTIGVITPSRPIYNIKKEVNKGIEKLNKLGYKIKYSKNFGKTYYYSAGTPQQRADDINQMFADRQVKAIICATGGSSANQLLDLIDFNLIRKNPKIFLGYSDITVLLLAIYKKSHLVTFHGPTLYELGNLSKNAQKFLFDLMSGKNNLKYPLKFKIIKPGKVQGELIGGNIFLINSLIGTKFLPNFNNSILFWEEVGESPAIIDFRLNEMKLAGIFNQISGMIIGHLSNCYDKKYPNEKRSLEDIFLTITKEHNFPIIQAEYFGHDIKNFYTMPIGTEAVLNTSKKIFRLGSKIF